MGVTVLITPVKYVCVSGGGCVCGCNCVGVEGSVWVGQP